MDPSYGLDANQQYCCVNCKDTYLETKEKLKTFPMQFLNGILFIISIPFLYVALILYMFAAILTCGRINEMTGLKAEE